MKKILITGPESCGKTYISTQLASYFKGVYVKEYARSYLEDNENYKEEDLVKIALIQHEMEAQAVSFHPDLVVCDTGIEVVCIWSQVEFKHVNKQIISLLQLDSYDLVILCNPNIPWEADYLRSYPNGREWLFKIYQNFLSSYCTDYKIIDAHIDKRLEQAISFVKEVI